MLANLYNNLSTVAVIIISVAFMLVGGFLMTRITKKLKLPNVTAYIVAGILMGPYCLNLVPANIIENTDFISDIALAFIAFGVGEFFKFDTLKKNGIKIIVITLFEALLASVVVFAVMFFILRLPLAFSAVLAALASATAPASTVMTIRQTKAKGEFVDTLLEVVALDDVVSLVAYSVAISLPLSLSLGTASNGFDVVFMPIVKNGIAILLGMFLGLVLKLMLPETRSDDNRLIIAISILFLFCGVCAIMDISPLLGCMIIGTVYINVSGDNKLFLQVGYFSPPILLLFFVRSGLSFNLSALWSNGGFGGVSLWLVGVIYFVARIAGKYLGAFSGAATTKSDKKIRNYLGLGLVPQAGVAIGLAALGARTLGGEMGDALQTIILASSVLYELIGPACAKLALYLSKSYTAKIDDVVVENTEGKNDVELLIERIQKIKKQVAEENEKASAGEKAFTEAAIKYNQAPQKRGILRKLK